MTIELTLRTSTSNAQIDRYGQGSRRNGHACGCGGGDRCGESDFVECNCMHPMCVVKVNIYSQMCVKLNKYICMHRGQ